MMPDGRLQYFFYNNSVPNPEVYKARYQRDKFATYTRIISAVMTLYGMYSVIGSIFILGTFSEFPIPKELLALRALADFVMTLVGILGLKVTKEKTSKTAKTFTLAVVLLVFLYVLCEVVVFCFLDLGMYASEYGGYEDQNMKALDEDVLFVALAIVTGTLVLGGICIAVANSFYKHCLKYEVVTNRCTQPTYNYVNMPQHTYTGVPYM